MPRLIDLTNRRFGKLVVESHFSVNGNRQHFWKCQCDCGGHCVSAGHHLRQGSTKSCGCESAVKETHGLRQTRAYRIWSLMRHRCTNENSPGWNDYGGRGIRVCDSWRTFEGFFADMGHPPDGTTLDRIDNGGNYEPKNCRWATRHEQANNKRNNIVVTVEGEAMTLKQASRKFGFNYKTAHQRLARGWSLDRFISIHDRQTNESQP